MNDRKKRSQKRRTAKKTERAMGIDLSRAQRRYLRALQASPMFRGTGGRQPQTRDALLRKGYLRAEKDRDVILLEYSRGRWRWP